MINTRLWNLKGVSNASTITKLKELVKCNHVILLAFMEPMIAMNKLTQIRLRLSFSHAVSNINSSLWILWNGDLDCSIVSNSE